MKVRKLFALNLAAALSLASFATPAQKRTYDPDRAGILCMVGGFPDDPGCPHAYGRMIDRIARFPDPCRRSAPV